VWLVVPWYLPLVFAALLLAAMLRSFPAMRARPVLPARWHLVVPVMTALAIAAAAAAIVIALRGARVPGAAVELEAPLRGGTYLVANGGSNALVSAHVKTLGPEPRFQRWRGQSYGVDLVRVNASGRRARGLLSRDPAAYFIFGDTVVAPCTGRVVSSSDGLADLPVPEMDREHMAGNHLILECDGHWVLLAHLRRGSVLRAPGDSVDTGEPLGQVGNTGNTGEPHLHIHAQLPGTRDMPMGGDPVPITIAGRYLVRGARVEWRRAPAD
jgi:murein DD-endopeptidase MepM/ murein hydrolase activator NlpD